MISLFLIGGIDPRVFRAVLSRNHHTKEWLNMRLISSRQAWHDCFYTSANSTMDSAIEQIESGITCNPSSGMSGNWKKTKPGKSDNGSYRDNSGKFMHQALAGRVQMAISCLPEVHKRFGMMMYAPLNFINAEDVEIPADWLLRKVAGWYVDRNKPLSNAKYELLPYLVRALLTRHRIIICNRDNPFKKPKDFRDYLREELGVNIPAQDFTRNYGDLINRIAVEIDNLDKNALVPVSKVINEHSEHHEILADLDKKDLWDSISEMWDACFVRINQYCRGLKV